MKLLHAADLHLDSPFERLPPEKSAARRRELRTLPTQMARLVKSERADLVLLPGDLLDGDRVYPETVRALAQALEKMAVPVFIAPGNHDYYHDRSPYATTEWPDNVHIFTSPQMREVALPKLNCVVHGCAFTAPHREDDPLAGFSVPDDGRLHLLCLHGEVGKAGRYAPISPKSLEKSGADYAALGHIHAISSGKAGKTYWAYSGCPEGRGFDETGPKGALIVALNEPGAVRITSPDGPEVSLENGEIVPVSARLVTMCRRQYQIKSVDINDFEAQLPPKESPDLVRFLLTGESRTPLDLNALTELAKSHYFYVELRDGTTLPHDLWTRVTEDSLTGLFLREMQAKLDGTSGAEREMLMLAVRFGLAALEGGEDIRP